MQLSVGCNNRRPLVRTEGSGVSALVGLDGSVVLAQVAEGREW